MRGQKLTRCGQSMVELGLMVAIISIAALVLVIGLGPQIVATFTSLSDRLEEVAP